MKFSLKHLILFVTIAALLCGVTGYAYNRVQIAHQLALRMRMEAEQSRQVAEEQVKLAEAARQQAEAALAGQLSNGTGHTDFSYRILHWNVESGGNDPVTIASQLIKLGRYDIVGLSEVENQMYYALAIMQKYPDKYLYILGQSGGNDRLMLFFDRSRFKVLDAYGMQQVNRVILNNGRHRAPLYVRLMDRYNGEELIVVLNHLARGDAEFRTQQAEALREWARSSTVPIIAIGDYNFDYDFKTKKGNAGFDAFMKDGVWKWIKPEPMIDSNWSDDGKGGDRYPDSLLDFNFVAGAAKDWKAECRVIVRDGDFPDDEKTSEHRPVELILSK